MTMNAINYLMDIVEGKAYAVALLAITTVIGLTWQLGNWSVEVSAILAILSISTSFAAMIAAIYIDD